jgi:hypothetical protein
MKRPTPLFLWCMVSIILGGLATIAFLATAVIAGRSGPDLRLLYPIFVAASGGVLCFSGIALLKRRRALRIPNCVAALVLFTLWSTNFLLGGISLGLAAMALFNKRSTEYLSGQPTAPEVAVQSDL